ncbi:MAG: c-type cytochrome, partial [Candidatus Omnitrophica bacterium]|nr:c-type cytochrome [Candidatus Omnitrophota bacterium]
MKSVIRFFQLAVTVGFAALVLCPAAGAVTDGAALYAEHCARCHGDTGAGDGPDFVMQRPRPTDFTRAKYKFRSTPLGTLPHIDDVRRIVKRGNLATAMPPFEDRLTEDEINTVSDYVLNISREFSGLPDGAQERFERPLELDAMRLDAAARTKAQKAYKRYCMVCHGEDGRGLGVTAGTFRDENKFWVMTPDITDADAYGGGSTASEIAVTLKAGVYPVRMPAYDKILDDETVGAVALYCREMQVPSDKREPVSQETWHKVLPSKVRGEYLFRGMSCSLCHNSYDERGSYYPGLSQAGGVIVDLPGLGVYPSSNITSNDGQSIIPVPLFGYGN